ncbi:MAG: DUF2807 domain-containing protein [Bacteroides sp.]|nr:DUF2807 domain-containing protein [Bacteroides sp.]
MKKIACCLMVFCVGICSQAQENFTQFHFSGLEVIIRQAEEFSYRLARPELYRIQTEQGWLVIEAKSLKGKLPKSKIELWVRDVENLCVHNGKVCTPDTLNVEFLEVEMAASSGEIRTHAHYVHVNLGTGSRLTVEGTADRAILNAEGSSVINAGDLIAEEGEADVRQESQVTAFIRQVNRLYTDKGTFTNRCP